MALEIIGTPTLPEGSEDSGASEDEVDLPERGVSIGRFLVLGPLGLGGMAMVLSAYDPRLDRKVALKLLRGDAGRGPLSEGARERLVREAQAMARLSHPNVVAVHEIAFGDHAAYLVMEQVVGSTLRGWLKERPRPLPEILAVLMAAGAGLAAAHRAGLVHHDFKPENVLVGDDGRARVSDFGLAGEGTPGAGTRAYMAPEQLGDGDIDARADQFAFCVTLWEALHGARPAADPAPPAPRRAPRWLVRALSRGLARDPADRWPSMDALLAELRRRRSRGPRAGALAAVLAVGAAAFLVGRQRSVAYACDGAAARLAGVWDAPRMEAARAAFASTGLPYADAEWRGASDQLDTYARGWVAMHTEACRATHVEGRQSERLLDLRMECLERRRARLGALVELWTRGMDRPAVSSAVDAAESLPSLAECADARALAERVPAPAEPGLAARVAAARRDADRAQALGTTGRLEEARKAAAAARVEAEATGWPQVRADASFVEGDILNALSDPGAERRLLDAARLAWEAKDDRLAARALVRLADHLASDELGAARGMLTAAIAEAALARAGQDDELRVDLLFIRGSAHMASGELAQARSTLTEARAEALRAFGPHHRVTLMVVSKLVPVIETQGEYAAARTLGEENLQATMALYGADHPWVTSQLNNLGIIEEKLGHLDAAGALYRRSLAIKVKIEGLETIPAANTLNNLAGVELRLGHLEEAEDLFRRSLAIREKMLGPEHPHVATSLTNLAELRREQGRPEEALELYARALRLKAKADPESASFALTLLGMGWIHSDQGDAATALGIFRRALQIREKALGADHPLTQSARIAVAWALTDLGRCDEATPLADTAIAAFEKLEPGNADAFIGLVAKGRCELASGRPAAATVTLQRAVVIAEKQLLPVQRGLARAPLARALWAAGRRSEAVAAARQAEPELASAPAGAHERAAMRTWLAARSASR